MYILIDQLQETHTPPTKRMRQEDDSESLPESDQSVCFSTDPSQQDDNAKFHYSARSRTEWVEKVPDNKITFKEPAKEPKQSLKVKSKSNRASIESLLDHLMTLVEPKQGKKAETRKVVREMRTKIRLQEQLAKKDCPKGYIAEDIVSRSAKVGEYCQHCGLNHFLVELYKMGQSLYGITTEERNRRMSVWMNKGTSSYMKNMQKQMRDSPLTRLLENITSTVVVKRKGREYVDNIEQQVNDM